VAFSSIPAVTKPGDVAIIGGGVIGVCSAYYLARKGWRVTLLEKGDICSGCSYGNAGLIVPSHAIPLAAPGVWLKGLKWMLNPESPFYIKPRASRELLRWLWRFRAACSEHHVRRAAPLIRDLSLASLALYRELAGLEGLSFGYTEKGAILVCLTERRYEEAAVEARLLEGFGVAAQRIDGAEARFLEPALLPEVVGGVYFPLDAHLVPDALVKGLARIAGKMGVRLCAGTEVLGFKAQGSRIAAVETTRGDFEADEVVLAAGSWSGGLARALGLDLPVQPAKGYSVTYKRPPAAPAVPVLLGEARMAVTPMGETLRFGGTLELAGLDLSISRRRVEAVRRAPGRYLAGCDGLELIEVWRGLRPCMPDGLPVIGRPKRPDNFIVATGHAMMGVSLGPITGKLVADLASRETPQIDLALLKPDRFSRR
jgi:D-amino-acid dehydrogenase